MELSCRTILFRSLCLCLFEFISCGVLRAQIPNASAPNPGKWSELERRSPWVFLGDSNTYAGGYVAVLDAWLHQAVSAQSAPKLSPASIRLLNLGVSSETCSGLSEVDHPFKRPCVHERIDKVLRMTKPGVVFACYGMNDGIYDPPNAERLSAYQAGMKRLSEKVIASGALFIVLTPPIFEPEPVAAKGKFGPTEAGHYAYFAPYSRYDDVLNEQAAWCMKNELNATAVIDIRSALQTDKAQRRTEDTNFAYSTDGVHFGEEAHVILARTVMKTLGAPAEVQETFPTAAEIALAKKRMQLLRDAYLSATGKNRPGLPAGEPLWSAEQKVKSLFAN